VSDSALPDPSPTTPSKRDPLRLLAYVHLRNIHESTGSGRVARQMVEHLALRDDVKLRILADAADQRRILPLVGEPWTNFEYATFANDTSRQQARWLAMERPRAESYWPEADVVFCTGESYVPKRKARLAVTLHDAAYFEEGAHRTDRSFRLQQLKWRILFHRLSRRADMFHTVSQFSANRLSHFFPKMASRMRVVHNGVAPHFFEEVKEAGEDFLVEKKLNGRQYVLVPGGLHYRKNAELILRAAPMLLERFPDLVLAVVNHSNAAYAEQAHALSERVRLLGFVSEEALHSLYAAATVVWFPSRYEGFGLPVVEAMACGAPVVAMHLRSRR
jgi:glycosyltransferase involved in cell wall biosynthesis